MHFSTQRFTTKSFAAFSITFSLLFAGIAASAQSNTPLGNIYTPVALPGGGFAVTDISPAGAPEQFTTNLIGANTGIPDTTLDGNIAVLDNSFSNGIDNADGLKVTNNPGEDFYLVRNNTNLLIEARKQVVSTDTLFYNMADMEQRDYRLEFYPINMVKPGLTAILVDKYLATRTPVSLSSGPTYYNFTVSSDPASGAADRFMLILIQAEASPLPVNFISVAANQTGSGVQVSWKVAAERDIASYSIEKSLNGRSFTTVGTVTASQYSDNEKNYTFQEVVLPAGLQYYRIKSTGLNGEIKYSSIARLSAGGVKSLLTISPNPVPQGSGINLQLTKMVRGRYDIRMQGIDGKVVYRNSIQHAGNNASYGVSIPSGLSKGTYLVTIFNPDNTKQSQLVIVGGK